MVMLAIVTKIKRPTNIMVSLVLLKIIEKGEDIV